MSIDPDRLTRATEFLKEACDFMGQHPSDVELRNLATALLTKLDEPKSERGAPYRSPAWRERPVNQSPSLVEEQAAQAWARRRR